MVQQSKHTWGKEHRQRKRLGNQRSHEKNWNTDNSSIRTLGDHPLLFYLRIFGLFLVILNDLDCITGGHIEVGVPCCNRGAHLKEDDDDKGDKIYLVFFK